MWDIHAKGLMEMRKYVSGEIGKVQTGVPEETMRSYVAGEIGKVKAGAGLTEEQEKLLKLMELEKKPEREIGELLGLGADHSEQYVIAGLQIAMRYGAYGHIRPGDYIVIGGKKFYVAGVNCQFNSNRNGEILPIKNHVDFICMDTGVVPALSNEQVAKYKADPAIKNNWSLAAVNKIMEECVFPSFKKALGMESLRISEKFVGFYGEEPLFQKLWIPTEKELLGTNVGNPEYKDIALQGQYPYFVLHPNAYISNKLFLLSKSIGGQLFFSSNGTVLPGDFGFLQANGGKNQMVQIPIGFRIQI